MPISRVLSDLTPIGARSGRSFLLENSRLSSPAAYPWRLDREGLSLATYSALLQLGFTVPSALPQARWALTPPFHPYLYDNYRRRGGLFSVALSVAYSGPSDYVTRTLVNAQVLPGSLSMEPGLSSIVRSAEYYRDRLAIYVHH